MTELQPVIVFHGRHVFRHLGICNPICVKLLAIMSGVIPRNLEQKKTSLSQTVFLRSTNAAYTRTDRHTHTHTDRHTDRHTHIQTHTHTQTHTNKPTHIHLYIYIYIYIYIYVYFKFKPRHSV